MLRPSPPCSTASSITATCSNAVRGVGGPKRQQPQEAPNERPQTQSARTKTQSEKCSFRWELRPQTPGIYRFPARMADLPGAADAAPSFRPLGRRSGRIPALPYPPPRWGQYKPRCGAREDPGAKKLAGRIKGRVKTRCPGCAQLAGFEVTLTGGFEVTPEDSAREIREYFI